MTSALERTLTPPSDSHFSALFSIFLIFFYFDFRFISFRLFRSYVISTGQVQGSLSLEEEEEFWSRYLTKLSLCAPLQCQPRASCVFFKVQQVQRSPKKPQQQQQELRCFECFEVLRTSHRVTMVFYGVLFSYLRSKKFKRYKHILEFVQFLWKS